MNSALSVWMEQRLQTVHHETRDYHAGRRDVTLLAYHFWGEDGNDAAFRQIECAVRESWLRCGILKTVLAVNRVTPFMEQFAERFSSFISFQIVPELTPGRIFTMSVDCNGSLYKRFDTPYVLIVQNDGFPLRAGLDEFVGQYDFIGAPYVRDVWWKRAVCATLGCWVSNGGFSLRSHEICERAAFYWNQKYHTLTDSRAVSEDIFYTQTLPLREQRYRGSVRIADCRRALKFSYDAIVPFACNTLPFGFHGAKAFEILEKGIDA